jgi:ribosome-binding factor A
MGEEVRHALSDALAGHGLADPALSGVTVTVTEVRVSPDLRNATAFVTPLGGGDIESVVSALKRARGYFRGRIGHAVEARTVPEIRFEPDRSFEEAARVGALLRASLPPVDAPDPVEENDEDTERRGA